jgi:hypothetical protein
MRSKKELNKLLLVEGNDDQHVIWALCDKFKLAETFNVIDCKGIENLIDQIPVQLKKSAIDTLGIIIDADTDLISQWNRLRTILTQIGYKIPEDLPTNGLIYNEEEYIKIGVWIMPNNNLNGMLEDFLSFLAPVDDKLMPIIREHLNSIEEMQLNKYKNVHKSKALIHSWLAVQEAPGTPLGLSITKRYLTTDVEVCKLFIDWLKELFKA